MSAPRLLVSPDPVPGGWSTLACRVRSRGLVYTFGRESGPARPLPMALRSVIPAVRGTGAVETSARAGAVIWRRLCLQTPRRDGLSPALSPADLITDPDPVWEHGHGLGRPTKNRAARDESAAPAHLLGHVPRLFHAAAQQRPALRTGRGSHRRRPGGAWDLDAHCYTSQAWPVIRQLDQQIRAASGHPGSVSGTLAAKVLLRVFGNVSALSPTGSSDQYDCLAAFAFTAAAAWGAAGPGPRSPPGQHKSSPGLGFCRRSTATSWRSTSSSAPSMPQNAQAAPSTLPGGRISGTASVPSELAILAGTRPSPLANMQVSHLCPALEFLTA